MPKVQWEDRYSVGNQELDEQHRALFEIINRLHQVMMDDGETEDILQVKEKTFYELEDYGRNHFASEEAYMSGINYPDLNAHLRQHTDFLERIDIIKQNLGSCGGPRNSGIMKILVAWLHDHLENEDQKYRAFASSQLSPENLRKG